MNEMYWITRIGLLSDFCEICLVLSIIVFCLLLSIVVILIAMGDFNESHIIKKIAKYCIVFTIILLFVRLVVPSQKELLLIMGVGGTIDYIQSNDTAKELPEKAIDALSKYLENVNKEE